MRRRLFHVTVLVVFMGVGGCGGGGGDDDDLATNLARFEFDVRSAFGFCPRLGAVSHADIERTDEGTYRFRASVLEAANADDPACIPVILETTPCAREVALSERELTDDEVARLREAFQSVRILSRYDPECEGISIDPCVDHRFTWVTDNREGGLRTRSAGSHPCTPPRLDPSDVERVVAVLEELREEGAAADARGDCRDQVVAPESGDR